jgi:hypothetical protein
MRQPWLAEPGDRPAPDDFTPHSVTRPIGSVAAAFAIAIVVLLMGTSAILATSVLDLPLYPGTDALIAAAQYWNAAMQAVGLDQPHAVLHEQERALEALRF